MLNRLFFWLLFTCYLLLSKFHIIVNCLWSTVLSESLNWKLHINYTLLLCDIFTIWTSISKYIMFVLNKLSSFYLSLFLLKNVTSIFLDLKFSPVNNVLVGIIQRNFFERVKNEACGLYAGKYGTSISLSNK